MKQIYVRPKATTVALSSNYILAAGTNAKLNSNNPQSGNASLAASRGGSNWEDDDE